MDSNQSSLVTRTESFAPFEISLNQSGENITINCKGSDGQQVADTLILALSKMPRRRKENGLTEFIIALASISILFWLAINSIVSPLQPQTIKPIQAQTGGK